MRGGDDRPVTLDCPTCVVQLVVPKADLNDGRAVCHVCGVGVYFGMTSRPYSVSDEEIAAEARTLAVVLDHIFDRAEPVLRKGEKTRGIDDIVHREITAAGVGSSFHGYNKFPAYCTTSINEEVINTLPSDRRLQSGDLLKLQIGISGKHTFAIRGWTYAIGAISVADARLVAAGRAALERGRAVVRAGAKNGDIGAAIQSTVEEAGFSVARDFVGHRIGTKPHESPRIPGYGVVGRGRALRVDWVLSVFVIALAGSFQIEIMRDGWNAVAVDGKKSVVFSHMILVRKLDGELLTRER